MSSMYSIMNSVSDYSECWKQVVSLIKAVIRIIYVQYMKD